MEKSYSEYCAQIDRVGKSEWSELLSDFDDANIYQTWSYGNISWNEHKLSHVLLESHNKVVALAQIGIVKLPVVRGGGIATLYWGPLWRLRGTEPDVNNLAYMIKILKEEYVTRRRLELRIIPNVYENGPYSNEISSIFEEQGFRWKQSHYRTLVMDLSLSLEELRKNLVPRWRTDLNRSEKNEIEIVEGTSEKLYDSFKIIYDEMHARKQFVSFVNPDTFRAIQKDLPDHLRMKILLCRHESETIAAAITSIIGDTGLAVLWATNTIGRKMKAAFLLQWKTIEELKSCGCRWYDLGGVNPDQNPGPYRFKVGLCGKSGKDILFVGKFDTCESLVSKVLVKSGDQLKIAYRSIRLLFNRIRKTFSFWQ